MAKTGLFFASADGDYSDKEKNFIEGFISGIENIGDIDDELKAKVNDATSHTYTLDEIVSFSKGSRQTSKVPSRKASRLLSTK